MRRPRRRAEITLTAVAERQVARLTDPAEIHALDRALAALSADPTLGVPIPGTSPELRDYTDPVDVVRLIYYVTARRTVLVLTYLEVG